MNLPLWLKITIGAALLGLALIFFWPKPQPDGVLLTKAQRKRELALIDSLNQRYQVLETQYAGLKEQNRVDSIALSQRKDTYNNLNVTHKAQTDAHQALPASAQHAANRQLLEHYPGPSPCKYCNEDLPK